MKKRIRWKVPNISAALHCDEGSISTVHPHEWKQRRSSPSRCPFPRRVRIPVNECGTASDGSLQLRVASLLHANVCASVRVASLSCECVCECASRIFVLRMSMQMCVRVASFPCECVCESHLFHANVCASRIFAACECVCECVCESHLFHANVCVSRIFSACECVCECDRAPMTGGERHTP